MTVPHVEPADDERRVARLAAYDDALASRAEPPIDAAGEPDDLAVLHLLDRLRSQLGPSAAPETPDPKARYLLRGVHAEGGVGQIWLAYDTELGREVALKVLRPDRAGQAAFESRFIHEARITGRLQHPGIVPVYELAADPDTPIDEQPAFYTMRLVKGRTLTEAIAHYHEHQISSPVARATLLNAFVSVCNTIAYAHTRGVVHRDLKPDNIALGNFGEVVVLDWGFARVIGQADQPGDQGALTTDARQTSAGQVLGTPAYMAPEQAAGEADERSDVYGLGAILYEMLTGQPPYAARDAGEVLAELRETAPPKPSHVKPGLPPALEAICLKAIARDPADRYATPSELASDMQHWLADEPVSAFPESPMTRLRRWCRRHPAILAASIVLVVAAVLTASIVQVVIRREQALSAETRLEAAVEHAVALTRAQEMQMEQLYLHRIALAERTLAAYNPSRAIELLAECPENLRAWEWNCLNRLCRTEQTPLRGHTGTVQAVTFSPDGNTLATAGFDKTIRLWDVSNNRCRAVLAGHDGVVYDLAFSPDGRLLASAGWDGTARLWDPATGATLKVLQPHGGHVEFVAFSPDSSALYTLANDGVIRTWDTETGKLLRSQAPSWKPWSLCASPDGSTLAVGEARGAVYLIDAKTGRVQRTLLGHKNPVRAVAFNSDGRLLASGDGDIGRGDAGEIRVWEVASGNELRVFTGHTDPVMRLSFHVSNVRLASASLDHTVKIWDLMSGTEALTLHAHTDAVRSVAFSHDGRRLASAGNDRLVQIWDGSAWDGHHQSYELLTLDGHADRALSVAFHPDGRHLVSAGSDWTMRLWQRDSTVPVRTIDLRAVDEQELRVAPSDYFAVAYSADGSRIASASSAGPVTLFDAVSGRLLQSFSGHGPGPVRGVAFRPGREELATASWDRTVRIWDLAQRRERLKLEGHSEPVNGVAYSPDGRWLASASYDYSVRIWDADTGRERHAPLSHPQGVLGVAIAPDGALLASAGNDGAVRLWDTQSWQEQRPLLGHRSAVRAVVFSPDGRWLASAGNDWTVRLWRVADGEPMAVFHGHTDRIHGLAFSPDSRTLASASYDKTIKLWNVAGAVGE